MEKSAGKASKGFPRAALSGLGGAAVLLLLELGCAALIRRVPSLQGREALMGRLALLVSAFLCALAAVRGRREMYLALAGTAEGVLLAGLILMGVLTKASSVLNISLLLNLLCLLCGGFAACLAGSGRRGRKRRRR